MADVEQTKCRILREAIQDNIKGVRGIRTQAPVRPNRIVPAWLGGFFLIVSLAYLLVPSYVVSTGKAFREEETASSPVSTQSETTEDLPALRNQVLKPEIPSSAPQPLDHAVLPLSVKKIVIDPGHGGEELGAVSKSGVAEKELTLDIALRLRRLMEESSFEVMLTRNNDQAIPLSARAAFANSSGADIFVSIHINWMKPRRIRALETYYLGPTDDPVSIQLASMENRESGYSLADFRHLLEKIYIDARRGESRRLAKTIHMELLQALSQVNPLLENRGVKMAPFVVLVATEMPAILVEVACLSNEEEVRLLTSPDYREQIALALFRGIHSYAHSLDRAYRKGS